MYGEQRLPCSQTKNPLTTNVFHPLEKITYIRIGPVLRRRRPRRPLPARLRRGRAGLCAGADLLQEHGPVRRQGGVPVLRPLRRDAEREAGPPLGTYGGVRLALPAVAGGEGGGEVMRENNDKVNVDKLTVVHRVLNDEERLAKWLEETEAFTVRVRELREGLRGRLELLSGERGSWRRMTAGAGVYVMTGMSQEQVLESSHVVVEAPAATVVVFVAWCFCAAAAVGDVCCFITLVCCCSCCISRSFSHFSPAISNLLSRSTSSAASATST